jgi:PKD domain
MNTLSTIGLGYSIDNGAPVFENYSGVPLAFWDIGVYTFSTSFVVPLTTFTITLFTVLPGDEDQSNDTLIAEYLVTPYCQPVSALPDLSAIIPAPDTAMIIRACRNSMLQFGALGSYPLNNQVYHQSDTSSVFIWSFGDGTTDTGQLVNHAFTSPGTKQVHVRVVDIHGCESNQVLIVKVYISPDSVIGIHPPDPVCAGIPFTNFCMIQPPLFRMGEQWAD